MSTRQNRWPRLGAAMHLYWVLICASVRAKMQYKFDFIGSTAIWAVTGAFDFLMVAAVLWRFRTVQGWGIWEVGLLYAVSRVGYGIYRVLGEELDRFESYIVRGDFDSVLLRPWPSLFVLLTRNISLTQVSLIAEGSAVGWVASAALLQRGELTGAGLTYLLLASLTTACLYFAVGIVTASAAFRIVRTEDLQVLTLNATSTAVLYPLDIYPGWLRCVLLSVIPLGVGNYIPVRFILGKGGSWLNLALPPFVAAASLWVAVQVWKVGERRYHSTGS